MLAAVQDAANFHAAASDQVKGQIVPDYHHPITKFSQPFVSWHRTGVWEFRQPAQSMVQVVDPLGRRRGSVLGDVRDNAEKVLLGVPPIDDAPCGIFSDDGDDASSPHERGLGGRRVRPPRPFPNAHRVLISPVAVHRRPGS